MKFINTDLESVIIIEPDVYEDNRGLFFESYNENVFKKNNINVKFVQDNYSLSRKGTIRGLHYQIAPKAQGKLIRVVKGSVYDVVVDLRKDSKTYGKWQSVSLSDKNKKNLYVPPGFAHGFLALEDETVVLYKCTEFYSKEKERGIIWCDETLNISWPEMDEFYISEKDKNNPPFQLL